MTSFIAVKVCRAVQSMYTCRMLQVCRSKIQATITIRGLYLYLNYHLLMSGLNHKSFKLWEFAGWKSSGCTIYRLDSAGQIWIAVNWEYFRESERGARSDTYDMKCSLFLRCLNTAVGSNGSTLPSCWNNILWKWFNPTVIRQTHLSISQWWFSEEVN